MATSVGLIKGATEAILGIGEVSIDNFTFQLFYKWSVSLFVASSVAVCSSQFFGDPIACETADDSVDEETLTAYCWMYSSFDIPVDYKGFCSRRSLDSTSLYNTYYQWVSIFLMVQGILFYLPRCIWLSMEGGLMSFLVKGHQGREVEDQDEKQKTLLDKYYEHVHNKFNKYALCFFFCEFLNILVSVSQVFVTHAFLNYQFLDYGYLVFQYYRLPPEERELDSTLNPLCEVFPKVAVCNYQRFGRGGGQETKQAMCILSLNIINDKVFALLWFWHCTLIIAGILRVITRGIQLSSSSVRFFLMKMQMHRYLSNNKHAKHIEHYVVNCSIGDWFVLYQMNKNMNKRFFAEFLALLSIKINPDPDLSADPEIDILKADDGLPNGTIDDYYDENELEKSQEKLKKKVAWMRKVNIFTGKRHMTKKKK
eukprot:GFUD01022326.1.p1 GENE.GFUD01022326.1~~GFUD01022326.1.p1  ORF type:complete len:425 (-),score=107.53 GFUD01022326.1:32-1306(-)